MRLSTDAGASPENARATLQAALDAGVSLFDTAGAYDDNESVVGRMTAHRDVTVVTKGGMRRPGGKWVPDGKRKSLIADAEASCVRLGVGCLDVFLVHAPDPRTDWKTTVRALAHVRERGLARRVGVSNVNLAQLDAAIELASIDVAEVALSPFVDDAARNGILHRCCERGMLLLAHSPLGGTERAKRLEKRWRVVAELAQDCGVTAQTLMLAWLYDLHPSIVPLPGARRPETARAASRTRRRSL